MASWPFKGQSLTVNQFAQRLVAGIPLGVVMR